MGRVGRHSAERDGASAAVTTPNPRARGTRRSGDGASKGGTAFALSRRRVWGWAAAGPDPYGAFGGSVGPTFVPGG
jgi:hypothetical protein